MRSRIRTTLFAFALSIVATAPAAALIPCELCEPQMDPSTRCAGICNGHIVRYCSDWFLYGCEGGGLLAQSRMTEEATMDPEERFLRSLREEAAAPAGLE